MVRRCRKVKPFYYLIFFYLFIILMGITIRILNIQPAIIILSLILLLFGALCFYLIFKAKDFYRKIYRHQSSAHPNDKEFG
ncbi:hypothetical protein SAMN04488522_101604 [Pedobacter caeni]|uniref:Uncharacterized protein n=2 Tax=Pedobacter caeni TaxID=288992 RepID=A0A1M4UL72_9SPHI|nr:hypothetical protein SAMN04488522_101604 [Pedobacter caeni]